MKKKYNCISRLSISKTVILAFFVIFSNLMSAQTQAPSIQTGVTFQWSDTQSINNDPATIQSVTIDGTLYNTFVVPTSYEMSILGPDGDFPNKVMKNGVITANSSALPAWDAFALSAFQDKNLNHYFTSDYNGDDFCENFAAVGGTDAQKQTISYSPSIPSNDGGVLAVTERGGNNCFYIEVWGTPLGGGPVQKLGETFVVNNSNHYGSVPGAPVPGSDYWQSGRVNDNGQTIAIALYYLNDLAPTGSNITRIEFVGATEDHGDGKFFLLQKYAVDQQLIECLDESYNGDLKVLNNAPDNSTYRLTSGPTPAGLYWNFVEEDGTYTYTPTSGFTGDVDFTYELCLPAPNTSVCDTGKVKLSYVELPPEPTFDVDCNSGDDNFSITVTSPLTSGGEGEYQYEYSLDDGTTYQISTNFTDIPEGSYSLKVKSTYTTCESTSSSNPIILDNIEISGEVTNAQCGPGTPPNGAIDVTVSGGALPYTYLWSNGSTSEDLSNIDSGTYTVTATDSNGCSISQDYTVNIIDVEDPQASNPNPINVQCIDNVPIPDITVVTDESDDTTAEPTVEYVSDVSDGNTCPETITRTYSVTDDCGKSIEVIQTITINDTTDPVLAGVPADTTVECDAVPNVATPTASDNCDADVDIAYGEVRTDGACDDTYTLTRTWTATDNCSNTDVQVQVITVQDTTDPVLAGVPADITVECDAVPNAATPTASDNCDTDVDIAYGEVRTDGVCDDTYTLTRTWTATDNCSNTDVQVQVITVQDTTDPVLAGVPADTTVECDAVPNAATPTASDNCDATVDIVYGEVRTDGACDDTYTLTRTWTATDNCSNTDVQVQVITVQDTTDPVLAGVPADITVECDAVPNAATPTASDNCDATVDIVYGEVRTDGACDDTYTLTRTWTATDNCSNTDVQVQVITVQDTTDPVLAGVPADTTVECDAVVPAAATPTASDNCDATVDIVYGEVRTDGACDDTYTLTRTWTATDNCSNTDVQVQVITVQDTTDPVLAGVPADTTVECDAVPDAATPTASDNCDATVDIVYGEVRTDGACDDTYTLTRTWTATDNCSNTDVQVQVITVQDTTDPVLAGVPADTTVECDAVPNAATPTASDNCDADVDIAYGEVRTDGACDDTYTLTRTWTATDNCSNTDVQVQVITVQDTTDPVLAGVPADTTVECDAVPNAATPTASDNCDADVDIAYGEVRTDGVCDDTYTLTRTWTATDNCSNIDVQVQVITVQDTTDPVLAGVPADTTVECDSVPNAATPTASDNCDADVDIAYGEVRTDGACDDTYTLTRTWTATDNCSNTDVQVQVITVQDTTDPVLAGVPADTTVECDAVPNVATPTASDNCDADVDIAYGEVRTDGACDDTYTLTRTWTATDNCSNTDVQVQVITVQDTTDPVLAGVPADTTVECDAVPNVATPTASDNCDADVDIAYGEVRTDGACDDTYTLTRTWTATDNCSNTDVQVQVITVQDTTDPVLAGVPADITVECDAVPNAATPTASDNCDADVDIAYGEVRTDGVCDDTYTLTRTWTATDNCSNTDVQVQVITVQDTTDPVLAGVPADTTVECDAVPNAATPTASDNCDATVDIFYGEVRTDGACDDTYTLTRTWTATDNCSNTDVQVQVITVQDTTDPTWTVAPSDLTVECEGTADPNDAFATWLASFSGTDNCGNATVTNDSKGLSDLCGGTGTETVTFTLTDLCGNDITADATFTIVDTTDPTWTVAPSDMTVECEGTADPNGAFATWLASFSGTDNCGTAAVTNDSTGLSDLCGGTGTETVTFTLTDLCGNNITADATFTIVDTTDPTWTIAPSDMTVECDSANNAAAFTNWLNSFSGTDICGTALVTNDSTGLSDLCGETGTETVTFTLTDDCNNSIQASATFTIEDTTGPIINTDNLANIEIECGAGNNEGNLANWLANNAGATAIENCGTFTWSNDYGQDDSVKCDNGAITVTFTATDQCGNKSTTSATYLIKDTVAPNITTSASNLTVECDGAGNTTQLNNWLANKGGANAFDNCSSIIWSNDYSSLSDDCGETGNATVTFTATDACGNTSSTTATFTIEDNTTPTIDNYASDSTVECDGAGNTAALNAWLASNGGAAASDVCSGVTWSNDFTALSDDCGATGSATVTFTATDACNNTNTTAATFTIEDYTAPKFTAPADIEIFTDASCNYDASITITGDVTDEADSCSTGIEATFVDSAPVTGSCEGTYVISRTWSLVDDCLNVAANQIQTITISDNTAPTGTAPNDIAGLQCVVDVPVADIAAVTDEADNCSTSVIVTVIDTNNGGTGCNGDPYIVTRTYTLTDCGGLTTDLVQTITVEDTTTYTGIAPTDLTGLTCDFANQAAVDTAFNDWITAQSAAIEAEINGCSPVLTNNSTSVTIPELCAGGTVAVEWTITNLCETIPLTANFTLTAPLAVTYTAPVDDSSTAAEFDDPDASVAQANLDADIAAWVTAQTDAITNSIAGGCEPQISNDFVDQSINFCNSGSITITWTVQDLCETTNPTATYTFTQPDGINFTNPSNKTINTCEFDDDDITVAQANLDADIAAWVATQNDVINNSLTGGSPEVSHDFTNQSIDLCTGGSITVNWTIEDICETLTPFATYTLTPAAVVTYTDPVDANLQSCDFIAQSDVNTAFNDWVTAQSTAISEASGCSPVLSNDSASATTPMLCTGGSVTVTWTITDLCETITLSADFNLIAADAVTYNNPADTNEQSCEFAYQGDVDIAFNDWVMAQSTAMAQAGGCDPVLSNNSASISIPMLCTGGSATVTWTITDLCETITVSADFNLTAPTAITFTNPMIANEESCDFADQTAVDTAFNDWVTAQSNAIAQAGGCAPVLSNNSDSASIPELCAGGSATVTWTITDLCETITISADFNLTAPVAITYNNPVDTNQQSCDFADQAAVDTAFNDWVNAQSTAIGEAGCAPVLSNDSASASTPELCAGGSVTVTWTIADLCETNTVSADFNLTAPTTVTYTNPVDANAQSCDFTNQAAIDSAFNDWITAQSSAIAQAGGCAPVLSNNSASITIPDLCTGGTVTVEWTITDLCETIPITADFTITGPPVVSYDAPMDDVSNAAEFDDPDATIAQANLDADIAAWVAAQTDVITNSITGGCNPQISNDFEDQSINFCNSGSITITWTVQDLCETTNPTRTYTFVQPESISFTSPNNKTVNTCDFDDDDITVAQANLDSDIAAWIAAQNDIINNSLTGGSPEISNDFANQSIDICTGGSIIIAWTIEDICETLTSSASYTLTTPEPVTYTEPIDITELSCNFTDQAAVDTAFNNWVTAQSSVIDLAGGCSPVLSNNSASISIPELCAGGTVTVEWTIIDLCETIPVTAEFTLTPPSEVSYAAPLDDTSDACEFGISDLSLAQSNLDADITAWVTNETSRINGSFSGGCNPTVTNDFAVQSINFCTGGSISIAWTITDLCETTNVIATYTFTQPEAPTFKQNTLPTDINVECDSVPVAEALTASNSCGDIAVNYSETITDGSCPSSYSILRTWTAINICGISVTNTQTITVEDNTAPELALPANITAECSDDLSPTSFGAATAVDNCDANPVITFNDVTTGGSCSGTFTITRTWTVTDACGNVSSGDQIISTIDTTVPEFDQPTLPGNIVVDCDNIPDAEILTATDNCGNATVTVQDVRNDGNCPNSYTIERSYTATDECGVVNTHVQTITVQDTTPPVFVETLPAPRIIAQCDAVPTPETLTATDTCGSATVTVSDSRTNGNCPNNYTLARTWVATDACGLTSTFTQIIIVQDTTAPTFVETLPRDMTVECDEIPEANTLTAIDNCGDAKVTISDVRTDGNCPSNYTIARTWTATDECGLTTTHTQIIVVQDTTAPIPASTFAKTLDVSCTDIPEVPEVEFTDNCSANVIIEFDETNTFNENVIADYQIIRTWTVRDACNNEESYTQTLNVALDEILNEVVAEDRCFDDGVINLNNYLAEDTFGGTWEIIEGNTIATINGSIFDPTNLDSAYSESFNPNTDGMQYVLRYTGFQDGCINITDVIMIVDASCKVLPCGENDVTISTAITPNGDDYNETFDIEGITLCGFVAEVKIFNRWGALVYESNEYTLGSEREGNAFGVFGKWNGTSPKSSIGNNGKLPNGTYYYIINLRNSGLDPITGPIYLGTK